MIEPSRREVMDGNEAVARAAYALSEVIALYPITPASPMGESCDEWAAAGKTNLWGQVPEVVELQSESGAAGALHGALTTGALATTFTSSQGLLLMIPAMYKIAGELSPAVIHVAARAVATHALSIFGDHGDVMAARAAGFALLCSGSVQEAGDFAAAAHAAALESRIPFLHFFDGFRTSHELSRVQPLSEAELRALLHPGAVESHRRRALDPERPRLRGSAQNPDVFFQSREASNPYYDALPDLLEGVFLRLERETRRAYRLYEYEGHPQAERVIVLMGSSAGAAAEALETLLRRGERVGLLKVRLYRPFDARRFRAALPPTARAVAVLDRTKEPGADGEPLFLDVSAALAESQGRRARAVIGGRYGLSSKEFTPAMAAAVWAELSRRRPRRRFTVGIRDDVGGLSLDWDPRFSAEDAAAGRALLYGLGSDGMVSAGKEAAKLLGERAGLEVQAYSVYDSKKSGSLTVTHLRYGPRPIRSTYLIGEAGFVAVSRAGLLSRIDVTERAAAGATVLLNLPEDADAESLPSAFLAKASAKRLKLYALDADRLARAAGLGGRVNTALQAGFFHLTGLLPDWSGALKAAAAEAYGPDLAAANARAVDAAPAALRPLRLPRRARLPPPAPAPDPGVPGFVRRVTLPLIAGRGEELPVSALPADGTFPTGTARWEKRAVAAELPVWEPGRCIECNLCALVCPHAAIRPKVAAPEALAGAPEGQPSLPWKGAGFPEGSRYLLQVAPDDCTGCRLCVEVCPPKDKALGLRPASERAAIERPRWDFFLSLPDTAAAAAPATSVRFSQLRRPLFEFPGACAGCGETPYLKLLSQLVGDRLLVANATGCSSIYGGNLPATPWSFNAQGRGPAWSNSLFENNAEFGLGFRLALDARRRRARGLLECLAPMVGEPLARELLADSPDGEAALDARRERVARLRARLSSCERPEARELDAVADALVERSVWIVGGDGWAYDIGFGGLDHILSAGRKVNVLVLDTEVYSNTGGQRSKATPRGAAARFASAGKESARKDLALWAMGVEGAYVARVALGANPEQALRAFREAEAYPGPSLIVAYGPCIAHGIDLSQGLEQQKRAVASGYWPLVRFDPRREPPLTIDSAPPRIPLEDYVLREGRYRSLLAKDPERERALLAQAKADVERTWARLKRLLAATEGGRA